MNVRLLFLAAPLALAPAAHAQPDNSPLAPLFECSEIASDIERLACLDGAVAALRGETDSGAVIAVEREQIEAAEEATYGLSIPGFRLPNAPRLSMPNLSGDAADLAEADSASAGNARNVVRTDDGLIERIEYMAIADIRESLRDKVVVELQNGQIWTQIDNVRVLHPRNWADEGTTASIRSAALGSYMMRIDGSSRWFRVRRTQ
jgi:hypothetical protein